MDGAPHDRRGFAQSVCLDGLAVACGAERTRARPAPADGDPAGTPAFLAAFAELRAALEPGIAKATRSRAEPHVGAPCRGPVSGRPGPHPISQDVMDPPPGARAMTGTASPDGFSTTVDPAAALGLHG